jgi:heme/copper-type cytochrome/quinol oxidase subunit 2
MKRARTLLTGVALSSMIAAVLTASALATSTASAGVPMGVGLPHAQQVALTIVGSAMNEQLSPSLGNIAIAAGLPVRVTVTNYTREYHTFTISGLNVSALILPARGQTPRTTTFTFTASRVGVFRWYCVFCAEGKHGKPHTMGGTVYVIINPSVLP